MTFLRRLGGRREAFVAVCWLVTLALVVLLLLAVRDDIDTGTTALVLLATSLVAALGSLRLSIAAALVGAMTFNVLFIPPYGSVQIASDASIVAFIVYPLIAAALGLVIHRLRTQMDVSQQRAAEALLLRDLTVDLVRQNTWLQPPLAGALSDLHRALDLRGLALTITIEGGETFEVSAGDSTRALLAARSLMPGTHPDEVGVRSLRGADDGVMTWPVAAASTVYGLLAVDDSGRSDEATERVARLFANVVALACERASLVQRTIQQQTLEATDRVRTALMQSVTHDLRTPLTSIRALASTLPTIAPMTEEQVDVVAEIETQSDRLARLVDQVLDLGRIDSGQLQPRLTTLAIDDVLQTAIAATGGPGKPAVTLIVDEELPSVPIDEPLMVQVVVNLIENAFRHGAQPLELHASAKGDRVELRMIDHGRGIPEAERRRLFDPSYAMRRPTADERSQGLGLAISAGFVHAHDGHIRVDPTPGGGATFVVSLPTGSSE